MSGPGEPSTQPMPSLTQQLMQELDQQQPFAPPDLLRWPELSHEGSDVASALFRDYQERRAGGETIDFGDLLQRHPEHSTALSRLLDQHTGPSVALPQVGAEVFGFRLCHELGAGAFARVFLAEETRLAGRPVVLKLSGRDGAEPQTLAQLQHTHIVPIHSVHEDAAAGLRAVCMPYFGGASLGIVLLNLWSSVKTPTRGAQLVEALQQVQAPVRAAPPAPGSEDQSPRRLLERGSYVHAAVWIAARLAEGLQHAHQRGVLHRDIKPHNVLLGADGQPMLLDFNLAQSAHETATQLGGTPGYMSPEHLRAISGRTHELASLVDQRSDIYSLGVVLFEMLAGQGPFALPGRHVSIETLAAERAGPAPSLRRLRPDIPWSLESIVRKCLAPVPAQRYQQAEHLAEDLRRFLDDRPLRHAPELSWLERAAKWRRRHPRLTSAAGVAAIAGALLAVSVALYVGKSAKLTEAESEKRYTTFRERRIAILQRINTHVSLHDDTRKGIALCEQALSVFGILDRADWQQHSDWLLLTDVQRRELSGHTRELLLRLAIAHARLAPGDHAVLRGNLLLLDKAEAIADLQPSQAIYLERAVYLRKLGDEAGARAAEARADQVPPTSAHDHFLRAILYAEPGDPRPLQDLDRATELDPKHFWAWFLRGIHHHEMRDFQQAAIDFGICVGLQDESPWAHFNLACAQEHLGCKTEALRSYAAALRRNPHMVPAYVNRGLLLFDLGRSAEAEADYKQSLALSPNDPAPYGHWGYALEERGHSADADLAFRSMFDRLKAAPAEVQQRLRCVYGFAVCRRLPDEAARAFAEVLATVPNYPDALYGCGLLAAEAGRAEEAVGHLQRAVAGAPGRFDARRHLAVQLARCRRFPEAFQSINDCLGEQPHNGETWYAAACVAARAADAGRDSPAGQAAARKGLLLLQKAIEHRYGRDKAASDPDLAGIRQQPEFQAILTAKR